MDLLLNIGLPLSLAFIMFSLGIGLTLADFSRVLTRPRPVLIGLVAQVILLPIVAYALVLGFGIEGALAVGVMILALSPGGVTTSILTRLAGGDVALSITLTAVVSLLSVLTVPPLVALFTAFFEGANAPEVRITALGATMFAITAVPVLAGLLVRKLKPTRAERLEQPLFRLSSLLFVVIILAALAAGWEIFRAHFATLAPLLVVLNILMLGLGVAIACGFGLSGREQSAIAIEAGVQNGTLGIAVGALIASGAGLNEYALPSGVYGITMYLVTLPALLVLRRINR